MPASQKARKAALIHNRDRRKLDVIAMRSLPAIARKIKLAAMRAFERGHDINTAIDTAFENLAPLLTDAAVAAHLTGRLRTIRGTTSHMAEMRKAAGPYDEAVGFLQKRMVLTDEEIAVIAEKYAPEAVQVTRTASAAVEAKASKAIGKIIEEGQHGPEAVQTLRASLDSAGIATDKPYLLETLVRTQIQVAYSAGQWNANQDPVIDDMLWGYEYVTAGDDRVRPNHDALDGVRLPKDDPMWSEIFPPNGTSCRCDALEIYKDETELATSNAPLAEVEVDGVMVKPGPDVGWNFNPGMINQDTIGPIG